MFRRSREPIIPSRAALHGLRASLNEPVLRVNGLPPAPANAAIALFDGGYGELSLAVAVRSREKTDPAFFLYQQPIPLEQSVEASLEIGVAFAEGMGFLFDEDVVSGHGEAGRGRASAIWEGLLGIAPTRSSAAVELAALGASAAPELELDEELSLADLEGDGGDEIFELDEGSIFDEPIELDDEIAPPAEAAPERRSRPERRAPSPRREAKPPSAEGAPAAMPRTTLTKFRGPAVTDASDSDTSGPGATGGSKLGRVAIVRRRVASGDDRPSSLIKLLGSY